LGAFARVARSGRLLWTLLLAALPGLVGCHNQSSRTLQNEEDRTVAVADEIVTGMAKRDADILYEGEMRPFAVDPSWLRDSRLIDLDGDVRLFVARSRFAPRC